MTKKIFSYEEAAALFPQARLLTTAAVEQVDALPEDSVDEYQEVVARWAASLIDLGIEVKGVWLIDFDSGSGYYCWQYPEPSLQHFHGYEEGFSGRVKLQ